MEGPRIRPQNMNSSLKADDSAPRNLEGSWTWNLAIAVAPVSALSSFRSQEALMQPPSHSRLRGLRILPGPPPICLRSQPARGLWECPR